MTQVNQLKGDFIRPNCTFGDILFSEPRLLFSWTDATYGVLKPFLLCTVSYSIFLTVSATCLFIYKAVGPLFDTIWASCKMSYHQQLNLIVINIRSRINCGVTYISVIFLGLGRHKRCWIICENISTGRKSVVTVLHSHLNFCCSSATTGLAWTIYRRRVMDEDMIYIIMKCPTVGHRNAIPIFSKAELKFELELEWIFLASLSLPLDQVSWTSQVVDISSR